MRAFGLTQCQIFACRGTYVHGVSTRELARRAGVRTTNAIRMRRLRARRRLAASTNPAAIRLAKALSLGGKRHRAVVFSLSFNDA